MKKVALLSIVLCGICFGAYSGSYFELKNSSVQKIAVEAGPGPTLLVAPPLAPSVVDGQGSDTNTKRIV